MVLPVKIPAGVINARVVYYQVHLLPFTMEKMSIIPFGNPVNTYTKYTGQQVSSFEEKKRPALCMTMSRYLVNRTIYSVKIRQIRTISLKIRKHTRMHTLSLTHTHTHLGKNKC